MSTPYRYIAEGCGGIYHFDSSTTQYIGTTGCSTCVGVYFEIDDETCFAAHINALIRSSGRATDEISSAMVREAVQKKLDETMSGKVPTERMRSTLLMVCPMISVRSGKAMVGDAVSEAVQDWLGVASRKEPLGKDGFIVKHRDSADVHDEHSETLSWRREAETQNHAWQIVVSTGSLA